MLLAVTRAASLGIRADYEGGGQVPDRAVDSQDQARRGSSGGRVGDKRSANFVRNSRIQPMLVARSALSGIAGNYSGHPLRTRCVLTDAAGTARAVFLWSVERLRRVARLPVLFDRLSRIEASRWDTLRSA